jgi:hypothetical protein
MHLNLLNDAKIIRVENAAVAATSELVTDVVDTIGFDSIAFLAVLGDVTSGSVLTLTGKTNSASSVSSPSPVTLTETATFTAGASDADNKIMLLDIHQPRQRYVFASLTRTTQNAVVDGIFAILYNAHERPITEDASILVSTLTTDPA